MVKSFSEYIRRRQAIHCSNFDSQKSKFCENETKNMVTGFSGSPRNFFIFYKFIYLFLAVSGLRCCVRALSSCGERGLLFVAVRGCLIAAASVVLEHRLQARRLQQLWHTGSVVVSHGLQSAGSVVVAHGLSCSAACGIFPDQGSNPCLLHWQAGS